MSAADSSGSSSSDSSSSFPDPDTDIVRSGGSAGRGGLILVQVGCCCCWTVCGQPCRRTGETEFMEDCGGSSNEAEPLFAGNKWIFSVSA